MLTSRNTVRRCRFGVFVAGVLASVVRGVFGFEVAWVLASVHGRFGVDGCSRDGFGVAYRSDDDDDESTCCVLWISRSHRFRIASVRARFVGIGD